MAKFGAENVRAIAATGGAVPLAFGLRGNLHAGEVEPLRLAFHVVARDHLAIRDAVADAEALLVDVRVSGRDGRPIGALANAAASSSTCVRLGARFGVGGALAVRRALVAISCAASPPGAGGAAASPTPLLLLSGVAGVRLGSLVVVVALVLVT